MKRDSAVSPVIGSILLVAITVIIAAVIAAFVFGMTGDIQQTRVIAITSDIAQNVPANTKAIDVTNHGGKDAAVLNNIEIFIDGVACNGNTAGLSTLATTVGSSIRLANATGVNLPTPAACPGSLQMGTAARNLLVVVGKFVDGTSQVLLDTYQ